MDREIPINDVYNIAATRLSTFALVYFWPRSSVLTCTVNADLPFVRYTLHAVVGSVRVSGRPWRFEELGLGVLLDLRQAIQLEINRQRREN